MLKSAVISSCGSFRYLLKRTWCDAGHPLRIIMLNPSTADAELDDPTIRRCLGFANRGGYTGIEVVNLFSFRSKSPDEMKSSSDPIGPENDQYINSAMRQSKEEGEPILCGWGAHGSYMNRDQTIKQMAAAHDLKLVCLGQTSLGQPKHPLYIKGDKAFDQYA